MEKQFLYIAAIIFLVLGLVDLSRNFIFKNHTEYVKAYEYRYGNQTLKL